VLFIDDILEDIKPQEKIKNFSQELRKTLNYYTEKRKLDDEKKQYYTE
jgi:hypothetical protein